VFVFGPTKVGKSTLSKAIAQKLGVVRVKLSQVIREAVKEPFHGAARRAVDALRKGQSLSDALCVELLGRRL